MILERLKSRKIISLIFLILFLLALSTILIGVTAWRCTHPLNSSQKVVGILVYKVGRQWDTELVSSVYEAMKQAGYKVIYYDSRGSFYSFAKYFSNFVARKVDAILILPNYRFGIQSVLKRVEQHEIPIIFLNVTPETSSDFYTTSITFDQYKEGKLLCDIYENQLSSCKKIVEIIRDERRGDWFDRIQYFTNYMLHLDQEFRLEKIFMQNNRSQCRSLVYSLLVNDRDCVDSFLVHEEEMAFGIIAAYKDYLRTYPNIKRKDLPRVVALGRTTGLQKLVQDNWIDIAILENSEWGEITLEALDQIFDGKQVPSTINYPIEVIYSGEYLNEKNKK